MENKINNQILVTGLPGSGKTSFIAALFHYLQSTEIQGKRFSQYKPSPDAEYLTDIHNKWLECKEQDRTSQYSTKNRKVEMFLKDSDLGKEYKLDIPDVAGENFQTQFEDRIWEESYRKEVERSSAMVLFIHPIKIKEHVLIDQVMPELAQLLDEAGEIGEVEEQIEEQIEERQIFDIKECPTQVVLVDLLQFHLELMYAVGKLPITLIISAWDVVSSADNTVTPAKWLKNQFPLLDQFLLSNSDTIQYSVFGVSAQGGDLNDEEVVKKLLELDEPGDKIQVQFDDQKSIDISLPLQWLMDKWNK